jgi:hypothetical protein
MTLLKILNASPGFGSPLDVMQLDQNMISMLKHYEKRVSYCQLLLQNGELECFALQSANMTNKAILALDNFI